MELASSTVDPLKAKLIQWSNHFDEDLIFIASNFSKNLVRAPNLASNFHLHNDADNCKVDCFDWKVTLCNCWGYYTKYYTVIKNSCK